MTFWTRSVGWSPAPWPSPAASPGWRWAQARTGRSGSRGCPGQWMCLQPGAGGRARDSDHIGAALPGAGADRWAGFRFRFQVRAVAGEAPGDGESRRRGRFGSHLRLITWPDKHPQRRGQLTSEFGDRGPVDRVLVQSGHGRLRTPVSSRPGPDPRGGPAVPDQSTGRGCSR
jgi:hypothetical protein